MAEEFQGGVCGGNWWNPSRNLFGSSPCSSAINEIAGGFMGWPNHDLIIDMKATTRSSDDSVGSVSDGSSPQDMQKHHQPSIDSTLQMMGISLPSSTNPEEWNQDLMHDSARSDANYSHILQETAASLNSSMNYRQEMIPKNLCQDSFKQVNQSFQQQPLSSVANTSSIECDASGFPLNPYTSPLLQTLFDTDSPPTQQSLVQNQQTMNYSNEFMPKGAANSFMGKPSFVKQVQPLQFTNSNITPFWNATAASLTDIRANFLPSTLQSQFTNPSSINNQKPNHPRFAQKHQNEKAGVEKKGNSEPAFKRPRIETPSPLPTFKVRKEKLGDRITALQQLVSPFGKTDTASVLHEAIEYIKFLHDQVNVLSTPYLKNGSPPLQRHNGSEKIKDQEELKQDLKSRGLCLVPISSTFPVAAETSTDFWTPTFGGSFR